MDKNIFSNLRSDEDSRPETADRLSAGADPIISINAPNTMDQKASQADKPDKKKPKAASSIPSH